MMKLWFLEFFKLLEWRRRKNPQVHDHISHRDLIQCPWEAALFYMSRDVMGIISKRGHTGKKVKGAI